MLKAHCYNAVRFQVGLLNILDKILKSLIFDFELKLCTFYYEMQFPFPQLSLQAKLKTWQP